MKSRQRGANEATQRNIRAITEAERQAAILSIPPRLPAFASGPITLLRMLLIAPTGNLWFIYAIAALGTYSMLLRKVGLVESLMIAVLLSFVVIQAVIRVDFPRGIEALLWNIGVRGLLFFTLGFAFSETLTRLGNRSALGCALGLLIWAAAYYTLKNIDISRTTSQMLLGVPATFGAVYALQYFIARLPAMAGLLGRPGRRSLELFLTHQFFIGVAYIVLKPVLPYVSALSMLALTSGAVLLLSYLAASVLRRLPGNMLFSVPALGGRRNEGPPSAEVSSTRTFAGPRSSIPN